MPKSEIRESKKIVGNLDNINEELYISDVVESVCPNPKCGKPLIVKWSGVKCSKCEYWECY